MTGDACRPVRVVLVDDHPLLTHALAFALGSRGVACTIPALDDRATLLAEVHGVRPDVVLLDLDLGAVVGDGSALVPDLVRHGAAVLVVSASRDAAQVGRALMGGAHGFVSKDRPLDDLVGTVLAAARGEQVMDPRRRAELLGCARAELRRQRDATGPFVALSTREAAVLRGLMDGGSVRGIAEAAFVSESTVRTQVRGILAKLAVSSQREAVALAARAGWQ